MWTKMDELERLVNVYCSRGASSVRSKLDVLIDLERIRDSRVVPFLLQVLMDPDESEDVRIHVVKQLRSGSGVLVPADRPAVAKATGDVLADTSTKDLRLQAALALGDFTQIDGVLSSLSAVSLAADESIDLRYAAFTSIERAGPTPECIAALRLIARDETLGAAARSVLSAWHVDEPRIRLEEELDDRPNSADR
jgi:hypothetical protein